MAPTARSRSSASNPMKMQPMIARIGVWVKTLKLSASTHYEYASAADTMGTQ